MRFASPLEEARLLRRYKRFLADVEHGDGSATTVHCPNPGAMLGLAAPLSRVFLSRSARATRKLPMTLEIVEADDTLVGINTGLPNRLAEEAIAAGLVAGLDPGAPLRREVRYGRSSRIDLLLEGPGQRTYIEVKNVHLRRAPGLAEFPDCVTARGTKHLGELAEVAGQGGKAMMLFVVQRADCAAVALARDLDPAYCDAFARARTAGMDCAVVDCTVTPEAITPRRALPLLEA